MLLPLLDGAVLKVYIQTLEGMYTFLFCIVAVCLLILHWRKRTSLGQSLEEFIHSIRALHHRDHRTLFSFGSSLDKLFTSSGLKNSISALRNRIWRFVIGALLFFGAHAFTSYLFGIANQGTEGRPATREEVMALGFDEIHTLDRNIHIPAQLSESQAGTLNLILAMRAFYLLIAIKIGGMFITFSFGSTFVMNAGRMFLLFAVILLLIGLLYGIYADMLIKMYWG